MTREEIEVRAMNAAKWHKHVLLELPTGYGKTKLAIDLINKKCESLHNNHLSILLLVAKTVHKQTWRDEIEKWGGLDTDNLTIECYNSLKNYVGKIFDFCILDEVHHIGSELRLQMFETLKINHMMLGLSATIKRDLRTYFKKYKSADVIRCSLQNAIDEDILPEPKIYILPMRFDDKVTETIVINKGKSYPIRELQWKDKVSVRKDAKIEWHIHCTKTQCLTDMCSTIEWYRNKYMHTSNVYMKNMWLKLCGDRLKWLAQLKNPYILNILRKFKNERTLTFCASIKQTEILGKNCIHSKNRIAQEIYDSFNNGKIKHITSCQMLNEGVNLKNCRIGIYANIHASETITRQRMGRILRHKSPIVIIPYWVGTREEELVKKMLEEYDHNLIFKIKDINEIVL